MAYRWFFLVLYVSSTWNQYATCSKCAHGYTLHENGTCVDEDECLAIPCGPFEVCKNTEGSFHCNCNEGFDVISNQKLNNETVTFCIDKDECLSNPCGDNAICHNTDGSFYCVCDEGFYAESGDHMFTDPSQSSCKDYNECYTSPMICGKHASCYNTKGSFYCLCQTGFIQPSGERNFTGYGSRCEDVDECLLKPCGSNATCYNTVGNYTCICNPGFISPSGGSRLQHGDVCIDVDECLLKPCGSNATCYNTVGNYTCICNPGFISSSGGSRLQQGDVCIDVDECPLKPCGSNATCYNTVGNYTCICNPGFISPSGGSRLQHGDICIEFECPAAVAHKCSPVTVDMGSVEVDDSRPDTRQEAVDPVCRIVNILHNHNVCEMLHNNESFDPEQHLQSISKFTNQLLGNNSLLENMESRARQEMLALSLQLLEKSVMAVAFTLMDHEKKNMSFSNIEVEMEVLRNRNVSAAETVTLSAKGNQLDIHWRSVTDREDPDVVGVALIAFSQMDVVLNHGEELLINSHVLTATSTHQSDQELDQPINITFQNKKAKEPQVQVLCITLNHTVGESHWSRQDCTLLKANTTHTMCQCKRLASFAVLMALYEIQDPWHLLNLNLISYIGISISLVCLFISFVTFLVCRAIQGTRTTIHTHLCLCLFLAELLFLVGISQTSNKVVCAIIAGFLHYLFLTVFAWMCLEGIQLYLMVVKVFHTGCLGKRHMFPVGYGLPLLIVGISAAVVRKGYGTSEHCWLSLEDHFLWSFLGPVCAIILINIVFYCITLGKLAKRMSTLKKDKPALKKIRSFTLAAFAQLILLGCTWIFGIFQFRKETIVMAYIFTIINSFQGMFIFILHCLLNKQVREEYQKCFCGNLSLKGLWYSEFAASSTVPMTSLQQRRLSTQQKPINSLATES
ncbi:adhesion G protein-coupled receptor E5-like isoform X2 [Mobula hypostoma]|uniref:adhesion G protein-coupled receptor E5-like isoform X2 n=1 Tax=Mobula hypostoma TaxID=723540 RepID=UPI002FC3A893